MNTHHYPYIILGAGAAGLQMTYCLAKAGHRYLVLESGRARGQVLAEQHLMEHLETDWTQPYHVQPLRAFFERQLRERAERAESCAVA